MCCRQLRDEDQTAVWSCLRDMLLVVDTSRGDGTYVLKPSFIHVWHISSSYPQDVYDVYVNLSSDCCCM